MTTSDLQDTLNSSSKWAIWRQPETEPDTVGIGEVDYQGGAFRQFLRRYRQQTVPMIAIGVLILLLLMALFAPLITTQDPEALVLSDHDQGPSSAHWLGTDHVGRDIFARFVFAARVSLLAAAQATGIALLIGVPLGLAAGYFRGRVDAVISLFNDALMALPPLILAMSIIGALGPGLFNAMLAVGIVFSPRFLRLVRGTVLSIREETYVEASEAAGTPPITIMARHLLPNALPPLLVQAAFATGFAMLAEASLSFLGLGVRSPTSSWGSMLNDAFSNINDSTWPAFPPGIVIAVAVLAFNLVGDGLREAVGRERRTG